MHLKVDFSFLVRRKYLPGEERVIVRVVEEERYIVLPENMYTLKKENLNASCLFGRFFCFW